MSQGTVQDTVIRLKAFKKYLYFLTKNRLFSNGLVSPRFLVKNDLILKSAFFTCLCG